MTIREIDNLIEEGESLKQIAQAYSEIANLKIKRLRGELERNRLFFKEISSVYAMVKKIAGQRGIRFAKKKKTISLVITSNYRFYGKINSDILDFFVISTQKVETDRIVLGKAAIDYFRTTRVFAGSKEILLNSDMPTQDELISIINIIKDYNQVLVFYSQLKSLLLQQPQVSDITATTTTHLGGEAEKIRFAAKQESAAFIFEPELSKILQFFDSQILTLLLEETFLESEVARTASRFISMDQAETEANKAIKEYQTLKSYVKRNMDNNKILENFASMMAVRRGGF